MPNERSDVLENMWRKKVDGSFFDNQVTTIPNWLCKYWNLSKHFGKSTNKENPNNQIEITFNRRKYKGSLTYFTSKGRTRDGYRLWFRDTEDELLWEIKNTFPMSYMRHLESKLRKLDKSGSYGKVEDDIPFWEFLDIEFNEKKSFTFTAHYKQKSSFPLLFESIMGTSKLHRIQDYISKGKQLKIYKEPWRERPSLDQMTEERNVIYHLMDTKKKHYYVGEADKLIVRLRAGHELIKKWDYFRFEVLPEELAPQRVTLERMMIRSFAGILNSKTDIDSKPISDYKLVNKKVDSK